MTEEKQNRRMLGALLRIPFQAIVTRIHEGLSAAGYPDLSPSHLVVFQHMPPEGARLTDLAQSAQITKQSMGYLVDYLAERGYVERALDPEDGRARIVRLTKRGQEIERLARQIISRVAAEWADRIGTRRMRELDRTLRDLADILEEQGSKGR